MPSTAQLRESPRRQHASEEQHRLAAVGFFRIMEMWGAGNAEMRRILGSPPERTFYEWKSGRVRRLPEDTFRRIGYVAGIYKALQLLYSDLAAVRAYLDAARAPW
jgi:hypothetical protein